jgi:hypothetical protein
VRDQKKRIQLVGTKAQLVRARADVMDDPRDVCSERAPGLQAGRDGGFQLSPPNARPSQGRGAAGTADSGGAEVSAVRIASWCGANRFTIINGWNAFTAKLG